MTYRILVTGSRDWTDEHIIFQALFITGMAAPPGNRILVSGACPTGADAIAERMARRMGWQVERHPAEWKKYGGAAGPKRNAHMVSLGADICLAFILNGSRGATGCAKLAERAGIPTVPTLRTTMGAH